MMRKFDNLAAVNMALFFMFILTLQEIRILGVNILCEGGSKIINIFYQIFKELNGARLMTDISKKISILVTAAFLNKNAIRPFYAHDAFSESAQSLSDADYFAAGVLCEVAAVSMPEQKEMDSAYVDILELKLFRQSLNYSSANLRSSSSQNKRSLSCLCFDGEDEGYHGVSV